MSNEYPAGYTPMTDAEIIGLWWKGTKGVIGNIRAIERAILARLPKQDAGPVGYCNLADVKAYHAKEMSALLWGRNYPECDTALYAHPPKPDTAEREPIVWLCKTEFGEGISYSNKFWELHPDFYQGAQEKRPAAEREALLLNDARYRFLRNGGWEVLQDTKYWAPENRFDGAIDAARLDVAIDAAIRARGNGV